MARPALRRRLGDAIEDEEDLGVRVLVDAVERLGRDVRAELDRRSRLAPVVILRRLPAASHYAYR